MDMHKFDQQPQLAATRLVSSRLGSDRVGLGRCGHLLDKWAANQAVSINPIPADVTVHGWQTIAMLHVVGFRVENSQKARTKKKTEQKHARNSRKDGARLAVTLYA